MHDEEWIKRVALPVRLVDGHWEFLYGGSIPIRDGSYAELSVAISAIEDATFRKRVLKDVVLKVFDEDQTLAIALNDHQWTGKRLSGLNVALEDVPAGCTRMELIKIGPASIRTRKFDEARGGLWMRQKGVGRCELICSSVVLPTGSSEETATSLNHAMTLLSEQHEKHRISHTGNVYERVFYQEIDATWCPLTRIRNGVVADVEKSIIADAWKQMEVRLGWRPIPSTPVRKKRST